jgi:hypothetical protein
MGDDEFKNTIQQTTKSVKEISRMLSLLDGKKTDFKPIELKSFIDKSMSFVKYDIKEMSPPEIIEAFHFYGEHQTQRTKLLTQTLEKLRQKELDIKCWKPKEFAGLVKEIATLAPKELKTFYNFVEVAFDVNYFEVKPSTFYAFADIFHVFVNFGYLHNKTRTSFYRHFLLGLKDVLVSKTDDSKNAASSTVAPTHII